MLDAKTGISLSQAPFPVDLIISPNPFTQASEIKFLLAKEASVIVKVIDVLGKEISVIDNQNKIAGEVIIPLSTFDMKSLSGSVYFVNITIDGVNYSRKLVKL